VKVGRSWVSQPRPSGKSFEIAKWAVREAYCRVEADKGAPGVDGVSIGEFEEDLKNNLYRVWNRMSSGTYFPPPVKAVEISKTGGGVRTLGVPTVAERVAQTVVARELEKKGGTGVPPRLLWLSTEAVGAGCRGDMPSAVLDNGLGDRLRYPKVCRHRGSRSFGQSRSGEH
jgi:hypothetical protein